MGGACENIDDETALIISVGTANATCAIIAEFGGWEMRLKIVCRVCHAALRDQPFIPQPDVKGSMSAVEVSQLLSLSRLQGERTVECFVCVCTRGCGWQIAEEGVVPDHQEPRCLCGAGFCR